MLRTLAIIVLAIPIPCLSQPQRKVVAILLLPSKAPDPVGSARKAWAEMFARHGLVDGRDIEIAILGPAEINGPDVRGLARQAMALRATVLMGQVAATVAKEIVMPITRDMPLVLWGPDDGSAATIEALNRRGENVTGVMYSYFELVGKRFELMKEMRPSARRAAIATVANRQAEPRLFELEANTRHWQVDLMSRRARELGMDFVPVDVPSGASTGAVVRALSDAGVDVAEVLVPRDATLWHELARNGIAASGVGARSAEQGALLGGWSAGYVETAVRLAAKIVRGERAAAIPVERSREFGLAVNLRTARELGITVPASILLRADKVFE